MPRNSCCCSCKQKKHAHVCLYVSTQCLSSLVPLWEDACEVDTARTDTLRPRPAPCYKIAKSDSCKIKQLVHEANMFHSSQDFDGLVNTFDLKHRRKTIWTRSEFGGKERCNAFFISQFICFYFHFDQKRPKYMWVHITKVCWLVSADLHQTPTGCGPFYNPCDPSYIPSPLKRERFVKSHSAFSAFESLLPNLISCL